MVLKTQQAIDSLIFPDDTVGSIIRKHGSECKQTVIENEFIDKGVKQWHPRLKTCIRAVKTF